MASLAGMLQARGHKVTGSDQNVYPPMSTQLAELGIEILNGYKAENADIGADCTVVGNAISRGNAELEEVLNRKLLYRSQAEIVKETKPTPPVAKPVEQRAVTPKPLETASSEIITASGTEFVAVTSENTGSFESITPASAGPAPMQLEYRLAPAPTYPKRALQQRLTGTVLLQVLVGIDGRPLEVTVAQSSGHRDLDEAARAQVLRRWSFQPATRNGQAVQAIGMVPIEFAVQR